MQTGKRDGWSFRVVETCRGYWEAEGVRIADGRRVFRSGTSDPELLIEECVAASWDLDLETRADDDAS